MERYGEPRRYRQKGDRKPAGFRVGDLFTFPNGESALVIEVFDRHNGESKYGPDWSLRFYWTPANDGGTEFKKKWDNPYHGASRCNMFNQLSIEGNRHLIPATHRSAENK